MKRAYEIEIIVSPCDKAGTRCYGARLTEKNSNYDSTDFKGFEERMIYRAKDFCLPGLSVLVRPSYNDPENEGEFYEWRSFNGEPFEKVVFNWRKV